MLSVLLLLQTLRWPIRLPMFALLCGMHYVDKRLLQNPVCQHSWWKRAPAAPVATALEAPSLKEPLPDQNRVGRLLNSPSALHLCNQASQPQGSQTQRSQVVPGSAAMEKWDHFH
jgi:hypothetical protein